MWGRFAKSVGENALEGAATGVGQALGSELRPIVENVKEISDDVKGFGDRLDRMENDILEIKEFLTTRFPDPVPYRAPVKDTSGKKGK